MWNCTKCNVLNPDDSDFCRKCNEKRSHYKPVNSLIVTLGRLVAVIFVVATIIFIVRFDEYNASISLALIFTSFAYSIFFFLLSAILDVLIGISKDRKY